MQSEALQQHFLNCVSTNEKGDAILYSLPDSHPDGAVTALEDLVGYVEGGPGVDILPVAVLLTRLHVHLVLHGYT